MPKITYLASVSDGKISFPPGVLDNTMLSMEVNNTSTNDTIPTSKAVYDSIVNFASQNITEQDGVVTIKSDKYLVLPQVNQITNSNNYLQQGWYYQHFDINGLGTNEEIISGTKNTVIFWLSDSTEQIVEDIQDPTYIQGFNSGFQVGWWMSGVNDGRFPSDESCHFEITEIDANKITVNLYAKDNGNLWWVDGWLRNGKVDLEGNLSKDDYTVYCNGATATTLEEKLIQTQCGGITISNISLFVGGANFFGSSKNITCGNSNYTTIGNTLTVGAGLINSTYSGTVLGSYNEPNGGLLQVGGGTGESDRKTLFSVHAGGDGKIHLNAPAEVYKNVYIKNSEGVDSISINNDAGSITLSGGITTKTGIYTTNSSNVNTFTLNAASGDMNVKGNIYNKATLGSDTLKDNISDRVVLARKGDGGLYKSAITSTEISYLSGATSNLQNQINDLAGGKGAYSYKAQLGAGTTETTLYWSDGTQVFIPTTDISDVNIKLMALNSTRTNIEKYSVKFIAYKNGDTIIATDPLCESIVSNGIQLINSVDVKLNTQNTGIQVVVKVNQENVTLSIKSSISQF